MLMLVLFWEANVWIVFGFNGFYCKSLTHIVQINFINYNENLTITLCIVIEHFIAGYYSFYAANIIFENRHDNHIIIHLRVQKFPDKLLLFLNKTSYRQQYYVHLLRNHQENDSNLSLFVFYQICIR